MCNIFDDLFDWNDDGVLDPEEAAAELLTYEGLTDEDSAPEDAFGDDSFDGEGDFCSDDA